MNRHIIAFAGPSGVGKSTLAHMVLRMYPDRFAFAVSATTRPMRFEEVNGTDYFFLKEDEFKARVERGDFVEWEEVYPGRLYGTLKSEHERIKGEGKIMILDIDVLGALSIKKQFGNESLIVFIKPDSMESLEERLRSRKSDSEADIQVRIERFKKELGYEPDFDAVIVNATGDLDGSRAQLLGILEDNFDLGDIDTLDPIEI